MELKDYLDDELLEELDRRALSIKDVIEPRGLAMEIFDNVDFKVLKAFAKERELLIFESYDGALLHVVKKLDFEAFEEIADEKKFKAFVDEEAILDYLFGQYELDEDLIERIEDAEYFKGVELLLDLLPYQFRPALAELLEIPAASATNERILDEIKSRLP